MVSQATAARGRQEFQWVANRVVVSADEKGLLMSENTFLRWNQAAAQIGGLTVERGRKDGLLAQMRRVYMQANGERQHIARVGKVIAGL